jgi:hypothetical protein
MTTNSATIVALREWYDGDHKVPLTDRQREYLGLNAGFPWSMNYLRLPVELCVERLTVTGFDGPDGIGGDDGLLDEWWTSNRMDALQSQVHRATARDGDTYVLVEWDADGGRPRLSHEPAYDGDEGMKVHYLSNLRREMTMASKVWTESRFNDRGQLQTTRRLNLYLPDRLERYIERGHGWEAFEEPGYPWPIPNPIGRIPVVHFRWRDDGGNWGESEIEPLVPLQMALNKSVLDLLEAADKTGAALLTLDRRVMARRRARSPRGRRVERIGRRRALGQRPARRPGATARGRQRFYYPHGATVAYPPTVLPSDRADSKRGYSGRRRWAASGESL